MCDKIQLWGRLNSLNMGFQYRSEGSKLPMGGPFREGHTLLEQHLLRQAGDPKTPKMVLDTSA